MNAAPTAAFGFSQIGPETCVRIFEEVVHELAHVGAHEGRVPVPLHADAKFLQGGLKLRGELPRRRRGHHGALLGQVKLLPLVRHGREALRQLLQVGLEEPRQLAKWPRLRPRGSARALRQCLRRLPRAGIAASHPP